MDEYLAQVYYNPKRSGALGGVERLYRDVKKDGKYDISRAQIKKWLMKQGEIVSLLEGLTNCGKWI